MPPMTPLQDTLGLVINKFIVPGLADKGLSRHLRKHPRIVKRLGFKTIPHRTTISIMLNSHHSKNEKSMHYSGQCTT